MLSRSNSPTVLITVIILCACKSAYSQSQPRDLRGEELHLKSASGQKVFAATCASCHGLDGRGGKSAPNIVRNARLDHLSDTEISAIVSNGIPGTGMPAFHSLSQAEVHAVVNYLRTLQGRNSIQKLPGDSARGKTVFFGKGGCSSCHVMRGEGGFAGPDLTAYGADHSATEIADAIMHPKNEVDSIFKVATVVTTDDRRFRGSIRNEDNFSLQLQDADGSFHFLMKSDLKSLEYEDRSIMPTDYGQRLSGSDLNDLVSYVMSVGRGEKAGTGSR